MILTVILGSVLSFVTCVVLLLLKVEMGFFFCFVVCYVAEKTRGKL